MTPRCICETRALLSHFSGTILGAARIGNCVPEEGADDGQSERSKDEEIRDP